MEAENSLWISKEHQAYLAHYMKRVSRSFSLVAPEVDSPLALNGVPPAWKKMVLQNVLDELEDSVSYVLALPQSAVGYRKASLLMMLPALETILLAARRLPDLFTPRHAVKISRVTMAQCVLRARRMAEDNWAIRTNVDEMSLQIRRQLGLVASGAR